MKLIVDLEPGQATYSKLVTAGICNNLKILLKQLKTTQCVACGHELNTDRVYIYNHDHGWCLSIYSEVKLQWVSLRCPKCKYDTSINKLGINRG